MAVEKRGKKGRIENCIKKKKGLQSIIERVSNKKRMERLFYKIIQVINRYTNYYNNITYQEQILLAGTISPYEYKCLKNKGKKRRMRT